MPFNEKHANYEIFLSTLSEHRAPVVFWIGAGVSADAKLPNWEDLRRILADAAYEEIAERPKDEADQLEAEYEQAVLTPNLWKAFETLKKIVPETTYKAIILKELGGADTVEIPELHKLIWQLKATRGVVTLNIDGLEARAFNATHRTEAPDIFVGRDIGNHLRNLKDNRPFIARLHGHHSDRSTWVFTESELKKQIGKEPYRNAIQNIFSSFTVVFVGISAEDQAAGGFLAKMTKDGSDSGNHFWITDRSDLQTKKWADESGLLRVQYSVSGEETHTSVIRSLLEKVEKHVSIDPIPAPIVFPGGASGNIPNLEALRAMEVDKARIALNAYAKHLLYESANCTDTAGYQDFLTKFSLVIHQSWHLETEQNYNKFFGYTAVEKIHSGPFSTVWRIQGENSHQFALKIMQFDNLRKGPQMDSFRRGISSQKLLRDEGRFQGIAKIETAFEIPPSVIMDFVEGEDLEEISQKAEFDFWNNGLQILINLCVEIDAAHKSKFGILHRDIKPSNIMIPNYYYGVEASDHGLDQHAVKILNYDMTWHKDASGRVVPVHQAAAGYYAPELLEEPDSSRARDARVDSYGVGMTLARISTGKPPPIGGSKSHDWDMYLKSIKKKRNIWFEAAHNYLRRIVEGATQPNFENRMMLGDILTRLRVLQEAIVNGENVDSVAIMSEKLIYSVCGDAYDADLNGNTFSRNLDGYRTYQIEAVSSRDVVKLLFTTTQTEGMDWTAIDKSWTNKIRTAKEIIASGGWNVLDDSGYNRRIITLSAEIGIQELKSNFGKAQEVLKKAIGRVQID